MAKQMIFKVKLVQHSSNLIVDKLIFTWRIFSHTFGKIYCKYTLKTSVLLLHVNHDSNFLGIWSWCKPVGTFQRPLIYFIFYFPGISRGILARRKSRKMKRAFGQVTAIGWWTQERVKYIRAPSFSIGQSDQGRFQLERRIFAISQSYLTKIFIGE